MPIQKSMYIGPGGFYLCIRAMHNMHIWMAETCNFTIFYESKLNATNNSNYRLDG